MQTETPHMQKARWLLQKAKESPLSTHLRIEQAKELASYILQEAIDSQTPSEAKRQTLLARMMQDPVGKAFTTSMTDQAFRSNKCKRIADQILWNLSLFGIPNYLSFFKRCQLHVFKIFGKAFAFLFIPLLTFLLRKETSTVILPGTRHALSKHLQMRKKQDIQVNLNHLGEAILGEQEAQKRLEIYLKDLTCSDINYISIKISTIFSQIHLLGWDSTLEILSERLRKLYRAAMKNPFIQADGTSKHKFVNLDMEEYRDLLLTKELFVKVLNEPEFLPYSAGIVLQAYLPDSSAIQEELTSWAIERVQKGGAPIKIRIVKGANLAMEQVEASLKGWPQAPFKEKKLVDAHYKKMLLYGCDPSHAIAVQIGVASHNLFDISYALLLRAEYSVEPFVSFEMLEGMAPSICRAVQKLSNQMLLYCPVATKKDFQSAIAYLIRRLDENTGEMNFLRSLFGLKPGSLEWEEQAFLFSESCKEALVLSPVPRKTQNRKDRAPLYDPSLPFQNDPDSDFSLPSQRAWALQIVQTWKQKTIPPIPSVIQGKEIEVKDPSDPTKTLYRYSLASWEELDLSLQTAKEAETPWKEVPLEEKASLFAKAAQLFRQHREDLIGVMMKEGAKAIVEADPEVSEAIDFIEYYLRSMLQMHKHTDLSFQPKGTLLVTPPWNFPVSIPTGGIIGALACGNCVLFKPAPEAVLSGWTLVNLLWQAGIPKTVLQFVHCADDPEGSKLILDARVNAVILTGATATAELFLHLRTDLELFAETGGKNAMIITALSDRDLAIKDLVQSAFGHSGQKCSAVSLAILEREVYEDRSFRKQLQDAVESLKVASAWQLEAKITPLIHFPGKDLLRALTTLEKGEKWLVQPKQDPDNPNLWSPGVKLGVKPGSFMHQAELFGPVLAVLCAENLDHAIQIANSTPYGLTSGLHSLDVREHRHWIRHIEAGNLYINRNTTGAIVHRQPFGGCKASSFGFGAKAGGPHYVSQFAHIKEVSLPSHLISIPDEVNHLSSFLESISLSAEQLGLWYGSVASYAYWIRHFPSCYDPARQEDFSDLLLGQDNGLYYLPRKKLCLRIQPQDEPLHLFRVLAAAILCKAFLYISLDPQSPIHSEDSWTQTCPFPIKKETEEEFMQRWQPGAFERIRLLSAPSKSLRQKAVLNSCFIDIAPALANGYFELVHYLREVTLSIDYHRYGNLGLREKEPRKPTL